MKLWWLAALVVLGGCSSAPPDVHYTEPNSGVDILIERNSSITPDEWGRDDLPVVESVFTADVPRIERLCSQAFAKYPKGFVRKYLQRIYVAHSIHYDNYDYAGTYDNKTLYLVVATPDDGFTDEFVEQTIHHELSSVLFFRDQEPLFDEKSWTKLNPPDFGYIGYDPVWKDQERDWELTNDYLLARGFANNYGTVSVEEDLNVIAQAIFAGGPTFWEQVDQHKRLAAKARLLISFYNKLDPYFTEARFRAMAENP